MSPLSQSLLRTRLAELVSGEPTHRSQLVLWAVATLFALLLGWAVTAQLDIVAVAPGRLVPQTYLKIVQPAEAGIVRKIHVAEGDRVRAGQVLVSLDPTVASSDTRSIAGQVAFQKLQIRRIEAELNGRSLGFESGDDPQLAAQVRIDAEARSRTHRDQVAEEQAALERVSAELAAARETLLKLERSLPTYEQSASAYEKLAEQQLVGALEARDRRRLAQEAGQDVQAQRAFVRSLEASHTSQERKISQLGSAYRSSLQSERSQALAQLSQLQESLQKQGFREGLLELRAPQDGIVKELATTTIGAIVQPGTVLLSVVPEREPLLAEVYIRNDDVGFVEVGQVVRIKVSSYPFTKYGMLEGTVRTLGPDSTQDNGGAAPLDTSRGMTPSSFKALVELGSQDLVAQGRRFALVPGMDVQAEIRQGTRTVAEYLLSPIQRIGHEAGSER